MFRLTWFAALITGFYFITTTLMAIDAWAVASAIPGADIYCRGVLVGDIPVARLPVCTAVWLVEGKSWVVFAWDTLINLPTAGLNLRELVRTADVAVFVLGGAALSVILAIVWANAATRLLDLTIASLRVTVSHLLPSTSLSR